MTAKNITFEGTELVLQPPEEQVFENDFFSKIYTTLYEVIAEGNLTFAIDFDDFRRNNPIDIISLAKANAIRLAGSDLYQKSMLSFLEKYPYFYNFIRNLNANAEVNIKSVSWLRSETANSDNFILLKKIIDDLNDGRWTRNKNQSESQSGVSNLGQISEKLLEIALGDFIDETNFFKVNTSSVQSYGDFTLMCLPNNLWLSVKSNYARERLLASGFTTDIIGVGFFTDATEFTSGAKIRNFQKAGFLAMYVPDIPITLEQVEQNSSTYSGIVDFYNANINTNFPLNINGMPFIRKLSELNIDLKTLLSEVDIRKRTTIGF